MTDELIRLRPSGTAPVEQPPPNEGDLDDYLLTRRDTLAEELRKVETILLRRGKITRVLCAPGRMR